MLGSKYDVAIPDKESEAHVVNARGALPVSSNLSDAGRKIICQFLVDEIRIYIDLLNRATNLSDDDVLSSLEGLKKNCPDVMDSLAANKLE